ncbi:MAG: phenylalanine--tRNA ligase subunit beta [Bdellovibrionota bacterium]
MIVSLNFIEKFISLPRIEKIFDLEKISSILTRQGFEVDSINQNPSLEDVILDISVTPNRPDVLCHEGVARELAVGFEYAGIAFEKRNPYFAKNALVNEDKIKSDAITNSFVQCNNVVFSSENFLNAPTFFMVLDSIKVMPSPTWLKNLLEALGQTPVNNIVDASNYILLAYGQPNHAFDLDKIYSEDGKNKKITLRHANANETFIGLDGKTRQLHESDCVVADSQEVLALLGVLGGESSKVTEQTQKIVVEFANPNPVSIRRTSRRHGRQTDASFMFEKGIDTSARFKACSEFLALLSELTGQKIDYLGTAHSKNLESFPILKTEFPHCVIPFTNQDQKRILGTDIMNFEKQKNILTSLGFELTNKDEDTVFVTVPQWRNNDVVNAADLIEECIRVVGIDCIPAQPIVSANEVKKDDPHLSFIEKLSAHCANLGYNEAISLHFMRADDFEKCNLPSINSLGEPVALLNPIIGDEPLMHTTLLPDLLRKVSKNLNYGIKNGQLFHVCRTFQNYNSQGQRVFLDNGVTLKLNDKLSLPIHENLYEYSNKYGYEYSREHEKISRPVETPRLAGVIFGVKQEKTWQNNAETNWSLHDIISHVVELGRISGVKLEYKKMALNQDNSSHPMAPALHPGKRVEFYVQLSENEKYPLGWCGELHPKVTRQYEIETCCFAFEINIANMIVAAKNKNQLIKSIVATQKFPVVNRDFSFLLEEQVTGKEIRDVVSNALSEVIQKEIPVTLLDVYVFDIYRGKGIVQGKKSVAFKVSLEPFVRTLTEKDIQILSDKVIAAMEAHFKSQIRGL